MRLKFTWVEHLLDSSSKQTLVLYAQAGALCCAVFVSSSAPTSGMGASTREKIGLKCALGLDSRLTGLLTPGSLGMWLSKPTTEMGTTGSPSRLWKLSYLPGRLPGDESPGWGPFCWEVL